MHDAGVHMLTREQQKRARERGSRTSILVAHPAYVQKVSKPLRAALLLTLDTGRFRPTR